MSEKAEVFFFPNGNTAVLIEDKQVPNLQQSWFERFLGFLELMGVDVLESTFHMPDGSVATPFETEDGEGFNWTITRKEKQGDE